MTNRKKATDKTEEVTRKIWLAGLGAYGQGLDNLHQGYEKMSDQARDFFEELVSRGEQVEQQTKSGVKSTRAKIREQADKNKELLTEHFAELREKMSGNLTIPSFDKDELLEELQARVGKLSETLSKLVKPGSTKRTPAKKAPARKAPTAKTAATKAPAKSAPATKPATKPAAKTTARKPAARKPAAAKSAAKTKD